MYPINGWGGRVVRDQLVIHHASIFYHKTYTMFEEAAYICTCRRGDVTVYIYIYSSVIVHRVHAGFYTGFFPGGGGGEWYYYHSVNGCY